MRNTLWLAAVLAMLPAIAWGAPVRSTTARSTTAWGPRVGFSSGPDQFVFGAQAIVGEVAPDLTFEPSVEAGIGDHRKLFGINLDLHYHFVTRSEWRPYVGAGATLNVVSYDHDEFPDRDSETLGGGSLIVGTVSSSRAGTPFFGELKLGLGDAQDLKVMVGWYFR